MSKHFVRFANRVAEASGYPSVFAFAALDAADEILAVAREDLGRARTALANHTLASGTLTQKRTGLFGGSEIGGCAPAHHRRWSAGKNSFRMRAVLDR
jgi:hypothetical protein